MKIQNIYHLLQAALLLLLAVSCTQEESPAAQDKARQLTISVTDGGYTSTEGKTTRAVENGYTTEFTEGDACGLFVVRGLYSDKKMIYSNVKLTAERDVATGSLVWKPEAGTTLAGGLSDEEYYLYYPYRSDLDNTVISNLLEHAIEFPEENFFKPISYDWPVKTDQSSYADYTASDLMTASCTPTLHRRGIRVVPLVGPSSILLAMMASGLNGQSFAFNGYLPVKPDERARAIRAFERRAREGQAQLFIETPYRNVKLAEQLLQLCAPQTMLTVACDLTAPGETILTRSVADWRRSRLPELNRRPAIFILG